MQAKSKAYLTIYLSLVFGIILSLLLALIEGAAIGASRLQSELVADLGMDSVFAEYNRELLSQYNVFFIDNSYGTSRGNIGKVQNHLSNFMSYNMDPHKDSLMFGMHSFLLLCNPYLEIDEVAFATDENAMVWKTQAVQYMKDKYGIGLVTVLAGNIKTVEANELMTRDIRSEIEQKKNELSGAISEKKEIEENLNDKKGSQTENGFSYDGIMDMWDDTYSGSSLGKVVNNPGALSNKKINTNEYVTARKKNKSISKGCGLPGYVKAADSVMDELFFNEYLSLKNSNYMQPNENGRLSYEMEYILFGHDTDKANLNECVERLLLMRAAANYTYLLTKDPAKKEEVEAITMFICTILEIPEAAEILTYVVLGIWAYQEAIVDVKSLLQGDRISIIKELPEWNLSLVDLLTGKAYRINKGKPSMSETGLTYNDHLKLFLSTMNKTDKIMRSLDVVEMNIRNTEGNKDFRIDHCIDYIKASFGFIDSGKHEFVFSRTMRYE